MSTVFHDREKALDGVGLGRGKKTRGQGSAGSGSVVGRIRGEVLKALDTAGKYYTRKKSKDIPINQYTFRAGAVAGAEEGRRRLPRK